MRLPRPVLGLDMGIFLVFAPYLSYIAPFITQLLIITFSMLCGSMQVDSEVDSGDDTERRLRDLLGRVGFGDSGQSLAISIIPCVLF